MSGGFYETIAERLALLKELTEIKEVTAPSSNEGGHFYVIKLLGSCRNLTVG
jgi:hypothetical protein